MRKNKFLFISTIVLSIYALLGFIAVPKILKPQLEKAINNNITQNATVEKIEFNPFLLRFSLHGFKIMDENTTTLSVDKLYVDFAIFKSVDEQHINFKDIKVINPYVNIIEYEDGSINLQKLALQSEPKADENKEESSESKIKFQIYRTILEEAKIDFTKYSKDEEPFEVKVDQLNYTFYDMGTYKNTLASHNLRILLNTNTELIIKGGLRLSPFKMYGNVQINNLKPKEYLSYAKQDLNFDISPKAFLDLKFGYKVEMDKKLSVELDHLNLSVNNFDLLQEEKSILSLKNFVLDDLNLSYPQNKLSIESIYLKDLNTNIKKDKNGIINLANLVKKEKYEGQEALEEKSVQKEKAKAQNPWTVDLKTFTLKDSNINFQDLLAKLNIDTKNLNINLNNLKVKGQDVFVEKVALGEPDISLIDKKNSLDIQNKKLAIALDNISLEDSKLNIKKLNLTNKELKFKDNKNKLRINTKKSDLTIDNINKVEENITVDTLSFKNPSVYLRDYKNSLKIVSSTFSLKADDFKVENKDIYLKKAKISTPSLRFNDLANKTDVKVRNMNITASKVSQVKNKLKVASVSLYRPDVYLKDNKAKKILNSKKISLQVSNITKEKNNIYISKVVLKEKDIQFKDLLTKVNANIKNLNLNVQKISHKNNKLRVVKSSITKPIINIVLGKKDAKVDEKTLAENRKLRPVKRIQKATAKKKFSFDVGPVRIKDAKMRFEDKNLPIPFRTDITKLQGEFSELNSSSSKPTKLKLEGTVDKYGYTKITGIVDINDVKLLTDTNILFKNLAIKNFSPYSGKFIGRDIESGKLNLDLKYNIKKSDLNAQNSIVISEIKLGKKIDSPDAVDLPLELAIALLENSDGVIDLELPITGNIDDPKFSIAPIVWKVFTNLITKAITAPFRLLAAAFGIDEDKIKSLDFEFGNSNILPSEKESLDNIAKILTKKPKLAIKVTPTYHQTKDLVALQDKKFDKFLLTKMKKVVKGDEYKETLETLYKKEKKAPSLDDIEKKYTSIDKKKKEHFDNAAYVEHLRKFLASKYKVEKKELETLANKRISNITTYLTKDKAIDPSKISVQKDIKVSNKKEDKWAIFELDVAVKK